MAQYAIEHLANASDTRKKAALLLATGSGASGIDDRVRIATDAEWMTEQRYERNSDRCCQPPGLTR